MNRAFLSGARRIPWRGPINSVKLVTDGNSITAGSQDGPFSVGAVPGHLKRSVAPFTNQLHTNVAIGGQNTDQMISNAADVDGAYDTNKICVLFAQDITNQAGVSNARGCVDKLFTYVTQRQLVHRWDSIILATCGPVWNKDEVSQSVVDDYNNLIESANAILRLEWRSVADQLIETRIKGGPFDPIYWPNYLRTTFFDTTPRTDAYGSTYSNNDLYTDESGVGYSHVRIHYSVEGIQALAPVFAAGLLNAPMRAR